MLLIPDGIHWSRLTPARARIEAPRVTAACRRTSAKASKRLVIAFNKIMTTHLGLQHGDTAVIDIAPELGLVRIKPSEAKAEHTLSWDKPKTSCCIALSWPGASEVEIRPAEPLEYAYDAEGMLVVEMPAWAPRTPAQAAPAPQQADPTAVTAPPVPTTPPAQDLKPASAVTPADPMDEARNLLSVGMSARQVAEELALPLSRVSDEALRLRKARQTPR